MDCEIKYAPSYATLFANLKPGETLTVQSGSMSTMSANMELKTYIPGGFIRGMLRKILARESLFMNDFFVESGEGAITASPQTPGSIVKYNMH